MEARDLLPDLDHPYLKSQLIAYIGNKRALQGFLADIFLRLCPDPAARGAVLLDPFAGSGAVARLARYLGFKVLAGDWELYAYVLNYAHVCVGRRESEELFPEAGGMSRAIEELNGLQEPRAEDLYIARHYAPADTASADYRVERLFYTRENALRIDAVRARIEAAYPGSEPEGRRRQEKLLLLASLLYQCATHTNTSGVFKACHKGFGGHGGEALKRIMAPVRLQVPVLVDGPPALVERRDAAQFVRGRPAELCYLDPPYNQHQYGSNYHLLNTIARWDRPPVNDALGPDGRLLHKAGIRRDWVQTRSPYCHRGSAARAFRELLEAVDARWIVVSYSSGGTIAFEEMVEILSSQGRLSLHGSEYVAYRGGRQSIARQVSTQELALVLERGGVTTRKDLRELERTVALNRLRLLLTRSYHPERLERVFAGAAGGIEVTLGGRRQLLPMQQRYRFLPSARRVLEEAAGDARAGRAGTRGADPGELAALAAGLEACLFEDLREEAETLISLLADGDRLAERTALQRRILWLLRKYAHRKYRESFEATVSRLRALLAGPAQSGRGHTGPELQILARGLPLIEALARKRFEG
ncbi:MAG: DNA adenine methylase [Spirochaetales bacterium]|nr:DNA adenine methylase [Spirochaetales bacterium]